MGRRYGFSPLRTRSKTLVLPCAVSGRVRAGWRNVEVLVRVRIVDVREDECDAEL